MTMNAGESTEDPTALGTALSAVETFLGRFVSFRNAAQVVAVVLWVAHTYAVMSFETSPYLAILSAEKRSGKTRLLEAIERVACMPWRVVTPSPAVVFRKIDRDHPTVLL